MSHKEEITTGHHIVPPFTYFKVLIMLALLMALTVIAYYFNMGEVLNIGVAMAIAVAKMVLILLFFMHVKYSTRLTWVFAGAGFFWLVLLFTLTLADYVTRYTWISPFTNN
ncbi:MAG: cytochrome C oxidase subunit IV family protein [Candidatus Hydrogenedentes bacterium]|nr:cytochrome C oxidase subunit IV family protein [Candidatus Hydrogenedentota bacterium]